MALLEWTQRYPRVRALSCGLLSALFLVLSFPFFENDGFWWFAVLIPVPLMIIAENPVIRPSRAAIYAGLGTLPAWAWTHHWVWGVSKIGTPFLLFYLMLFPALFVWIGHRVSTRFGAAWLTLPVVWIGVEFLRGHAALSGYPWYLSAQPLIGSPGQVLAGPAAFAGDGGMYFVGLISGIFGWQLWKLIRAGIAVSRVLTVVGVLLGWVVLGFAGQSMNQSGENGRSLVVGIVQSNVPQDNRMDWTDRQRYLDWTMFRDLTIASSQDRDLTPELIVWPEGFVPGWTFDPISLEHEREYGFTWSMLPRYVGDAPGLWGMPDRIPATTIVDELLVMQGELGIPMVVGSVAFDNLDIQRDDREWVQYSNDGMYNSAFSVAGGEIATEWYNKMHLTPFGEVMPVISNWQWLEQQLLAIGATGMEFALSPGKEPVVLTVPNSGGDVRVGTPICFEATIPGVCRDLVFAGGNRRADILVNLTNDGWFGDWNPARRTHMLVARWRCIELGTPMIRSANTGISCVIDGNGGIVEDRLSRVAGDDPLRGYLNASVVLGSRGSIMIAGFAGWVFGWGMLVLTGIGIIGSFVQKRSEPDPGADE